MCSSMNYYFIFNCYGTVTNLSTIIPFLDCQFLSSSCSWYVDAIYVDKINNFQLLCKIVKNF